MHSCSSSHVTICNMVEIHVIRSDSSSGRPAPQPLGAPAVLPATPVAPPPLPADLAQLFDDPIGLDGALRAAPLTPSAAPIVSASSWLEQQELAEVLEEQLTELEALEAIEVSKRQ